MKGKHKIIVKAYESPCGLLWIGSMNEMLCMCSWQTENNCEKIANRLRRIFDVCLEIGSSKVITIAEQQLNEYFEGERQVFDIPLIYTGTELQESVWNELQTIPFGQTISYGALAQRIGKISAVRAVANAVGANPISVIIPCHRVIGSRQTLTGYNGGLETKIRLLNLEGYNNLIKR